MKQQLDEVHSDKLSAEDLLKMAEARLDSEADCQKRMRKKLEKLRVERFELVEVSILIVATINITSALLFGGEGYWPPLRTTHDTHILKGM
ncbi:unnamed protein product [Dibothriocephalus latus]|uniref:Uncharacterized protein n=1 Tax=Dibothriocephalus latus TaxID=60516 RepID=A0A3P7N7C0_DIBLA|nr:unnamed protein product [Dibothriocephalus latus]